MTTPPTPLNNSAMNLAFEGSASIADPATGNLLFYTDGITVWNQNHVIMPNGTGLQGNSSSTQSGVIVKQPGNSNIYFIFTIAAAGFVNGFNYSVVDMSLVAGTGSVTAKNIPLYTPSTEKVTAVRHCNGVDVWVLSHEWGTNNFQAHLVTAAGVNPVPVISSVGSVHSFAAAGGYGYGGHLKASPNGKKLGLCICSHPTSNVELYDFDIATGIVSNSLSLGQMPDAYGCEFSPDGTKFYAGMASYTNVVKQWDLCAGSGAAIAASVFTVTAMIPMCGSLQLGPDGKIYVSVAFQQALSVINTPNAAGAACNYVASALPITTGTTAYGLPNFLAAGFQQTPAPFTHTVNNIYGCQTASFNAPPTTQTITGSACSPATYSVAAVLWNFGDPSSGAANTSTLLNPVHSYSTLGTYTAQLIVYYNCKSDTFRQAVNINLPCIAVSSTSINCATLGSATVSATGGGPGPFSYTWMPSGQTGSVATNLGLGTYTVAVRDLITNFTYTATTTFVSPIPLTATVASSSSVSCNGAATGTAIATNIAGGSSTQLYSWSNGVAVHNAPNPANLAAGTWTYVIIDALTSCSVSNTFTIAEPPPLSINVGSGSPSVCAGGSIALSGTATSGSPYPAAPFYGYAWSSGATTASYMAVQAFAGSHTYTLTAFDMYNCSVSGTVSVQVVPNPALTATHDSICPLHTATLSATGATSYSWNGVPGQSIHTASPLVNTTYTLTGEALGCTSQITASVFIMAVPVPTIVLTSPQEVCLNSIVTMSGTGGSSYSWKGPGGFSASGASMELPVSSTAYSGIYTLTALNQDGCSGTATQPVTVLGLPAGSFSNKSLLGCAPFQADFHFSMSPGSPAAATMSWIVNGQSYSSSSFTYFVQEPGNYPVYGRVTDINGCTGTFTASIQGYPKPEADFYFTPDRPVENSEPVSFINASPEAVSSNWFFDNQHSSQQKNTVFMFEHAGTYPVALVISDARGCRDTIVKPVIIDNDFSIYVPNAFTPDGDGRNDLFGPVLYGATGCQLTIMNRWGEKIFETSSPGSFWDGTYAGKPCKQDVYIWSLEVTRTNPVSGELRKQLTGQVLLYR